MLTLIAMLTLTSPMPMPACKWWSKAERRCRDADVEIIGTWDPRPAPHEWQSSTYYDPPAWGTYPTEKRE